MSHDYGSHRRGSDDLGHVSPGRAPGKRSLTQVLPGRSPASGGTPDQARPSEPSKAEVQGSAPPDLSWTGLIGTELDRRADRVDDDERRDRGGGPVGEEAPGAAKTSGATERRANTKRVASDRFGEDPVLGPILRGRGRLARGDRGLAVTKIQQALVDLGFRLPRHGVDGTFNAETRVALRVFQRRARVEPTGVVDGRTLRALVARFSERDVYVAAGLGERGRTRRVKAGDRERARTALTVGAGRPFRERIRRKQGSDLRYGPRITRRLRKVINRRDRNYRDLAKQREQPNSRHQDQDMNNVALAAKRATDATYGGYAQRDAPRVDSGTLRDQWAVTEQAQRKRKPAAATETATAMLVNLIQSECAHINEQHRADITRPREAAILGEILNSSFNDDEVDEQLRHLELRSPGFTPIVGGDSFHLQFTRAGNTDSAADREKNRQQMWKIFHICIHEYLHLMADPDFVQFVLTQTRYPLTALDPRFQTLIEGFCEFFTVNARENLPLGPDLIKLIEGPYYTDGNTPPLQAPRIYGSRKQAEHVIAIIGIANAQAAYFHGNVAPLMAAKASGR